MAPAIETAPTPAASSAAAATPAALIHALAQPPPTRTAFAEARYSALLDRPLLISGELVWQGGEHLQRLVTKPYRETSDIRGGEVAVTREGHATRHFSLDRAPALKALLRTMVAVLAGDPDKLNGLFEMRIDGDLASWTLTLTPTQPSLRKQLAHIRLDGAAQQLRCIHIIQTNGDASIDLLGPLAAQMPAQPTRAALTALCR